MVIGYIARIAMGRKFVHLVALLVCTGYFASAFKFYHTSNAYRAQKTFSGQHVDSVASILGTFFLLRASSSAEIGSESSKKIKLPIIQAYNQKEMAAEFICGNDIPGSLIKFRAYLKSLHDESAALGEASGAYISNIYSDDQLASEIADDARVVKFIKLYRDGCKKCAEVDSTYYDLANEFSGNSQLLWYQAEVANIPNHIANVKARLTGGAMVVQGVDCKVCGNSGFTACSACGGMGVVTNEANTLFCAVCVGYKKVRCAGCGGKCISCAQ